MPKKKVKMTYEQQRTEEVNAAITGAIGAMGRLSSSHDRSNVFRAVAAYYGINLYDLSRDD